MQIVPALFGKQALAVAFRLFDALAVGQSPAINKPVYMGIYGEGRLPKALCHNDLCRFMANAGELFKLLNIFRNF